MSSLPTTLYRTEQVREFDRIAIQDRGIPGFRLMQRAGQAAFDVLRARWPEAQSLIVLTGPGNNGGDGFVVARLLSQAGWTVRVALLGDRERLKGDARIHADRWSGPVETLSTGVLEGAELVVDFTYTAEGTSGGGVKNPYVAVWVEDRAGELVATIALWFLQSEKGPKWLSDLRRWATVDGSDATIDAISSATRRPGEYSVLWDGTDTDGNLVAQGDYYIAIESSREHPLC